MTQTQLYPPVMDPRTLTRQVWDSDGARRIPGVGRALDLIGGLIAQMPLDAYRGIEPLPRPRLLDDPDLDKVRSVFVRLQVDDFLLHGNACHLVTARYSEGATNGWPASVRWYPATAWHVYRDERTGRRRYYLHGREVPADDVVHVQNGADPLNDCRGVGVVERYVRALDLAATQLERERLDTASGHVPSVVVIAPPDGDETEEELDAQATAWEDKFSGPGRRAAMLPHGTQVTPLAWSPNDAQATAARAASLTDVANMFNLDGYYLGAPASSHTYRTPGAMFVVLVRTTLNGVLAPFEDTWSRAWLPRGQRVTFARAEIQADDMPTTITMLTQATGGPVMVKNEARALLRLAPVEGGDDFPSSPAPPAPSPDPDPELDLQDPATQEEA